MLISINDSRANGFKKWSDAHTTVSNDDEPPGGAAPVAVVVPSRGAPELKPAEEPYHPWRMPGVGTAF